MYFITQLFNWSTFSSLDHGAVLTQDTEQFIIGQKVWVGGIRPGQIAYIGETHFAPGDWAGIVLDEPNGKYSSDVMNHFSDTLCIII